MSKDNTQDKKFVEEYYNKSILHIKDISLFVTLVNELNDLSKQGRINDMRRLLVVSTINYANSEVRSVLERLEDELAHRMKINLIENVGKLENGKYVKLKYLLPYVEAEKAKYE